ncbi:3-hydroxyacyl-ACP dehydratase [Taibaiella koreensis]|uniref:3-hydroxyacyl-ACP dehydratase n=1 Tax=Taibaiella koreensis TaxID=1268548 RepID=UPI000E59D8AF|nr:3-hydroxyacyl-ACP dehydratase [Taibaiella koreensis]
MQYIPQAAPFEMIDAVEQVTETETCTRFTIREGHLFVDDGVFTEPGLIENMAQTAAAGTGWKAAQQQQPAPVGFIGAVKNFEVTLLPAVGDTIVSTVTMLHQVMNAHVVQGRVMLNDELIAEAEFKIFLQ